MPFTKKGVKNYYLPVNIAKTVTSRKRSRKKA